MFPVRNKMHFIYKDAYRIKVKILKRYTTLVLVKRKLEQLFYIRAKDVTRDKGKKVN